MSSPTGRLAPSPTGLLHLGHARSFLLAWWSVRSRGGRFVLRMEDLDHTRVRPGMADAVLRDLEWLGLDWDGEVAWQSQRLPLYRAALAQLEREGHVYACVCTRKEIELALSAPHLDDGAQRYPGTCAGRFASAGAARARTGRAPAMRFRVPGPPGGTVHWTDEVLGPVATDVFAEVGDFPVFGRDGFPAYQLAVVVDDADQGVDEVLRGADLASSTGRQALLQAALGLRRPRWVHVPLVTDAGGRRLAKRSDDLALARLRELGADPRALVQWAAQSCGLEAPEPLTAREALAGFALDRLPREPVRLDLEALPTVRSLR